MSDDPNKRGSADRSRIALEQEHEVRYWTKKLNSSREDLAEAVKSVGNSVDRVREYLRGHGGRGRK